MTASWKRRRRRSDGADWSSGKTILSGENPRHIGWVRVGRVLLQKPADCDEMTG